MAARIRVSERLYKLTVPLATGAVIGENEEVGLVRGTRTANVVGAVTNMIGLGLAIEDVDQTEGDTDVEVLLHEPIDLEYFENASGAGAITLAANFMGNAYFEDGGTLTSAADNGAGLNYAFGGIVYDIDDRGMVGIRRVQPETAELIS